MGQIVAILSGKGGTGKTSVCAGIATALAQMGLPVLCIDCDVGLRNLDIALGLDQIPSLSFVDMFQEGYGFAHATKHPVFPNLSFLTAPVGCTADRIDTDAFSDLLQQARKRYSYIFLDAAAGIEAGFTLAAKYADRVVLVTGPDPASIRDANRAGQVLELMGKTNVRIIVNRVNKKMLSTTGLTVDDVIDQAGLQLLGIVPDDSSVVLSAAFRQPLLAYTNRGAAAACKRIARRLQGRTIPVGIK
ncbi:MAG: P-loop NTPase [Oscillospiraceae bacterium]|nr:P-loop NTPase [Oscillospiraceae bacterium]